MAWAGGTGFGGTVVSIYTVRTRWKSNRWPIVIFCVSVSSVLFSSCCFLACRCFFLFTFFAFLWASLENHHKRLIWDIGWFSVRAQLRVVSIPWVPIPGPNLTRPADNAAIATSIHSHHFSSWIGTNIWPNIATLPRELIWYTCIISCWPSIQVVFSCCFVSFYQWKFHTFLTVWIRLSAPRLQLQLLGWASCLHSWLAARRVNPMMSTQWWDSNVFPMPEAFEKVIKSSVNTGDVGPAVPCGSGQKLSELTASKGHTAPCSWASSGCSLVNGQPYGSIWQLATLG